MIVNLYTRHSRSCPQKDDPSWKRCHCAKWVSFTWNGKQYRQTTKEISWERGVVFARSLEERYQNGAGGKARPETMTVADAVAAFIQDKRSQRIREATLKKRILWFEKELVTYCRENQIVFLMHLDLNALRQWRSTWELAPLSMQKKQESVRQFMRFCQDSGWIKDNPAKSLSKIIVKHVPTGYFDDREMERILRAAPSKIHALVLLMRWSGLRISDAVTLERDELTTDNHVQKYQQKTSMPVRIAIPPEVAQELRDLPINNPRYFFWSGNGKRETIITNYQNKFRKLFDQVKLRLGDGSLRRCHPHMLRDTFAVNLLLKGVPLAEVSMLLGHSSVKTTEKHYAPWVKARQDVLSERLRSTW